MPEQRVRISSPVDLLNLHQRWPDRYPVLLESSAETASTGRFDLLLTGATESLTLGPTGTLTGRTGGASQFLDALECWWGQERTDTGTGALPFNGGWFLYLSYELAAEIEPSLTLPSGAGVVAYALRCHGAIVRDRVTDSIWLVAEAGHEPLLEMMRADLAAAVATGLSVVTPCLPVEDPAEIYIAAVLGAKEHIAAGNVYQANLSRAWRDSQCTNAAAALYRNLRHANPGPFGGLALLPGMSVLSTTPERLVQVSGTSVQTRPIAGTRPRIDDDARAIEELTANPKERAEHIMLIDLERNDLGRICRAGTVRVDEFCVVESYAHVHHLVSNIRGELASGTTPVDVIRAMFPGGTITGCPKVRCMQLIAELEGRPRGAYTGSMGYLDRNGNLDLNILIRTATLVEGCLELRAGAGIVADSDPALELEETRAKARGLLQGLRITT